LRFAPVAPVECVARQRNRRRAESSEQSVHFGVPFPVGLAAGQAKAKLPDMSHFAAEIYEYCAEAQARRA
jgi:hypothetical protein